MPMYEYRCEACDEHYEELVRLDTRDDEVVCPACGEYQSRRQVSVIGAVSTMSSSGGGSSCGGGSGFS